MAKIGIMGGTFDPIHFGHLDCAQNAQRVLELDEVLFMPAACPNFKQGRMIASANDRLAMCRAAIACEPTWHASALEIDRGGTTFTVDTLRDLHARRPDDELYFITGSDVLDTLNRWASAEELAHLATFVAVERPGYGMPEDRRAELAACGFSVCCVTNEGLDISSSDIRARIAHAQSLDGMVPEAVIAYIAEQGLYAS